MKAVTGIDGTITDTIKYDVYGCVEERTGESELIIGYNGEYGVLSDSNGLLYMRARYYNPSLKRFMSADIITGSISDSTTLNLFAYVNGNPISFVDPFGLTAERADGNSSISYDDVSFGVHTTLDVVGMVPGIGMFADGINAIYYAFEGDWGNALFSALAFVPIVGDISATGKVAVSGVKVVDKVYDTAKVVDKVSDTAKVVGTIDHASGIIKVSENYGGIGEVVVKYGGETQMPTQIKVSEAVEAWNDYLGPNQMSYNKYKGMDDMDRIFSSDGTKSIRFGNHEMDSLGTNKAHFHYEEWIYDPVTNTVTVYNKLQRLK